MLIIKEYLILLLKKFKDTLSDLYQNDIYKSVIEIGFKVLYQ